MQVANDGLAAKDVLTVEFEHESQHTVGGRVRRAHVDDHGLVVAALDVDGVGVDVQVVAAKHRTDLSAELVRRGVLAAL